MRYAADLTVSRVTTTIDGLRMLPSRQAASQRHTRHSPCGPRNFYAKAIKQLTAWMVREKRLEHDPLLHVPMRKVETDIRHDRRALYASVAITACS